MHVLFVTECRFDKTAFGDGSTRYRCFNVAEGLIASGHRATVASLSEVVLHSLQRYDVISVLRPRATRRLVRLIKAARKRQIHLVADFDDLIFDIDAAGVSPLVLNGYATTEQAAQKFKRFAEAGRWFDEITVSTRPLAEAANKCFPSLPVYLLANGLSLLWLKHADARLRSENSELRTGKSISYLPGTRSHDADFGMIKTAVRRWLSTAEDRKLRIVGALNVTDGEFDAAQVIKEPLVPYFQLPEKIQRSHVTLAPLLDGEFNRAKSHIKFLESAAFGVPVVATAIDDIDQHRGVCGLFTPSTPAHWQADIQAAVKASGDSAIRARLSRYVRDHWLVTQTSRDTIQRWVGHTAKSSATLPVSHALLLNDPVTFYPSLRPVPSCYTHNGWQPTSATHVLVFESDSEDDYAQLDFDDIEERVKSSGSGEEQWLVLVDAQTSPSICRAWRSSLRRWRADAAHVEVIEAGTTADRCSLLYQSDIVHWLTSRNRRENLVRDRTLTIRERLSFALDRWVRKLRKLRESPVRFFADSRIAKIGRF